MPGVVAYTFDDGPAEYNDQLLAVLKKKNVKATFFVLGQMIALNDQQAGSLKKILADGHQLASHTYTHGDLSTMSVADMQKEMSTTSDIMFKHSSVRPRYMRAPYGSCGEACLKVMADLGLVVSHWNVDTNDWQHKNETDPLVATSKSMAEINSKIVANSDPKRDSFIVLQHELEKFSVEHLADAVIDAVLKAGYRFVTMEECIGTPAYLAGSILPSATAATTAATSASSGTSVPTSSTGTIRATETPKQSSAMAVTTSRLWTAVSAFVFICAWL
ncbi:chitin deacetylase [Mortierella alpina]|nr:chitin deacetylase [Mortierella alpina]